MAIRILLVDDHRVVREGLKMFLELDPGLEVVGEAEDGAEGVEQARALQPDVILMDLVMPVMDGISAIAAIRDEGLDTEVLAVTSVLEDDAVTRAIRAGAIGYLLKDTRADDLCRSIRAAATGHVQLSPQAAARLLRDIPLPERPEELTERETEVLRLLATGRSDREIATALAMTEAAARALVNSVFFKLGVQSRTQAALYAAQIGLLPAAEVGTWEPPS